MFQVIYKMYAIYKISSGPAGRRPGGLALGPGRGPRRQARGRPGRRLFCIRLVYIVLLCVYI